MLMHNVNSPAAVVIIKAQRRSSRKDGPNLKKTKEAKKYYKRF